MTETRNDSKADEDRSQIVASTDQTGQPNAEDTSSDLSGTRFLKVVGVLMAIAFAILIGQIVSLRSQLSKAQQELTPDETKIVLADIGEISVENRNRLHWRSLPSEFKLNREAHGWRFRVPKGQGYRIRFMAGDHQTTIPTDIDKSGEFSPILATIMPYHEDREVIVTTTISLVYDSVVDGKPENEDLILQAGVLGQALVAPRIRYSLPLMHLRTFRRKPGGITNYVTSGSKATEIMKVPPGPMALAQKKILEYSDEVKEGKMKISEWQQNLKDPGYGYLIWIEPLKAEDSMQKKESSEQ